MGRHLFTDVIAKVGTNPTAWSVILGVAVLLAPLIRLYITRKYDLETYDRKYWQDERAWMWKELKRENARLKRQVAELRTWTDEDDDTGKYVIDHSDLDDDDDGNKKEKPFHPQNYPD